MRALPRISQESLIFGAAPAGRSEGHCRRQAFQAQLSLQTLATMAAGKTLDAYGHMPGNTCEQADGKQAYTQTRLHCAETWARLPQRALAERLAWKLQGFSC